MELFLDANDVRPLSVQVYDQLRDAIVEGQLAPGDRLGATRRVAADLGVSRSTVAEAYGRLVAEGYVEGRAGGGSVVSAVQMPVSRRRPASALAPTPRAAAVVVPYGQHVTPPSRFDLRPGIVDRSLFPRRSGAGAWSAPSINLRSRSTAIRPGLVRCARHWPAG